MVLGLLILVILVIIILIVIVKCSSSSSSRKEIIDDEYLYEDAREVYGKHLDKLGDQWGLAAAYKSEAGVDESGTYCERVIVPIVPGQRVFILRPNRGGTLTVSLEDPQRRLGAEINRHTGHRWQELSFLSRTHANIEIREVLPNAHSISRCLPIYVYLFEKESHTEGEAL